MDDSYASGFLKEDILRKRKQRSKNRARENKRRKDVFPARDLFLD